MTIKREVNGEMMEFELTTAELYGTFYEVQHNYDEETIQWYMDCTGVEVPEDKMDKIADIYRDAYNEYLDDCSDARFDFAKDAVREVLGNDN